MRRRDQDAYREFAVSRSPALYRSACLLTGGDTHLAEDLVQETLGRMYTVWHRRRCIDNPDAYARTVLVRAYLTYRRRRSSTERPADQLPELPVEMGDSSLRITLLQALDGLPPKDRTVLVLRYWEDLSVEQTADAMRVSSNAVRTRTSRALAKLRTRLGNAGFAELTAA
ncbi:SigE family RNA polymerase sigma factor [Streptomyces litchfieldiae]|uniref:SigE family RNA polymerase sigma factor n=1 Tax=Streptomyces litchfieldiae TaxID=3075543 RepID=A0ABU2MKB0_9ACTN|nr:SigE family RNA polymerase sigma factor [Streptomyces sp. DSM 44938]MDT0342052.1 SigE family RNA polymerase sigma factor [Streptomyces sp. DSM 44938]